MLCICHRCSWSFFHDQMMPAVPSEDTGFCFEEDLQVHFKLLIFVQGKAEKAITYWPEKAKIIQNKARKAWRMQRKVLF